MQPKHPDIKVYLSGTDGNAYAVIGRVSAALRRANVPTEEIKQFQAEAMSGDYDKVLQTCMAWVDVE